MVKFDDGFVLREKDVNLAVSKKLTQLLRDAGFAVVLTRDADVAVNAQRRDLNGDGLADMRDELQARVDIANTAKAHLFLSIHHNGHERTELNGLEMYSCRNRPFADQNRRLAALAGRLLELRKVPLDVAFERLAADEDAADLALADLLHQLLVHTAVADRSDDRLPDERLQGRALVSGAVIVATAEEEQVDADQEEQDEANDAEHLARPERNLHDRTGFYIHSVGHEIGVRLRHGERHHYGHGFRRCRRAKQIERIFSHARDLALAFGQRKQQRERNFRLARE